jgi:hypothetical protein
MRMIVEQLVEWRLAGETEVLEENLPQRHFAHHKSHMTSPGLEPRDAAVGSQRLTAWAMARLLALFTENLGYSEQNNILLKHTKKLIFFSIFPFYNIFYSKIQKGVDSWLHLSPDGAEITSFCYERLCSMVEVYWRFGRV